MRYICTLCPIKKKPAAQIAHLVFADTQAKRKKPKELFFANARTELTKFENDKKELKINGQTKSTRATSSGQEGKSD